MLISWRTAQAVSVVLVLSACASAGQVRPAMLGGCRPDTDKLVEAVDWSLARTVNIRINNDEFDPMILNLTQDNPYVLRFDNRDPYSHAFRAAAFFRSVALAKVVVDEREYSETCINSITVGGMQTAELRLLTIDDGRFDFGGNNFLIPSGGVIAVNPRQTVFVHPMLPRAPEILEPAPGETWTPAPADTVAPVPVETVEPNPFDAVEPTQDEDGQVNPFDAVEPIQDEDGQVNPFDAVEPIQDEDGQVNPFDAVEPEPAEDGPPAPFDTVEPEPAEDGPPAPFDAVEPEPAEDGGPALFETVESKSDGPVVPESFDYQEPEMLAPSDYAEPEMVTSEPAAPAAKSPLRSRIDALIDTLIRSLFKPQ